MTPVGHTRRRALLWALSGAASLSVLGLEAARLVKSPEQAAADTAAPGLSTLTAPVEKRVLKDTVVLRGKVGAGGSFEVTPTPANALPVVTRVRVKAGDPVSAATVLLEVAGRPLFALPGQLPVFRDLRPGSHGQDVAQLQAALKAIGHNPGETDGLFSSGTKKAVAALYKQLGYDPPVTGERDADLLEEAARQMRDAERALAQAREDLALLLATPPPAVGPGERNPVTEAQRAVAYAEEDLAVAKSAQVSLIAKTGVMLPASEVVFLPSFPARVDALKARIGAAVDSPLITLSSGALVVRAQLNPSQRQLLQPGLQVDITSELSGITVKAAIASIGELEQDPSNGSRFHPMVVAATAAELDSKLAGQDVRLTVEAAATDSDVLVVPLAALYSGADGITYVQVVSVTGQITRIAVTPGVSGDGYVAVRPAGGTLNPGDRVQTGSGEHK